MPRAGKFSVVLQPPRTIRHLRNWKRDLLQGGEKIIYLRRGRNP
jgi:hypothetical protein